MRAAWAILLAACTAPALAQGGTASEQAAPAAAPATTSPTEADYSDGEVRRVDKDAQKVTLRHGPIASLGMGEMTMVFRVADPAWLDTLKPGARIRFRAEKVGGLYTVTAIAAAE